MEKATKKKTNRPSKRVLVRWTDDLDKQILLCVQWACQESGIKVPWAKVAEQMGSDFTEGGIVQHLAKLRAKLIENDMSVPPPLRRGAVLKAPSSIYAPKGRKIVPPPKIQSEKAAKASEGHGSRPSKAKGKGRKHTMSDETEDEASMNDELYDSDEAVGLKTKKARLAGKPTTSSTRKTVKGKVPFSEAAEIKTPRAETPTVKNESSTGGTIVTSIEESPAPVAARTRGVRTDYSKLDGEDGEDEEERYEPDEEDDLVKAETSGMLADYKEEGQVSPRTVIPISPGVRSVQRPAPPTAYGSSNGVSYTDTMNRYPRWDLPSLEARPMQSFATPVHNFDTHYLPTPPSIPSVSSSRTTSLGGMYGAFPIQRMHQIKMPTNIANGEFNYSVGSGLGANDEEMDLRETMIDHNAGGYTAGYHQLTVPENMMYPQTLDDIGNLPDFKVNPGFLDNEQMFENGAEGFDDSMNYNI